jgi:hypothetical protein
MHSTASLGPGGTGPFLQSLPSGRGGIRPSNGQCSRVSNPSGGLWKAGVGCEVSGRSGALPQRQQAGALQTPREVEGAVGGRGSAWTAAACRRRGSWANAEAGPSTECSGDGLKEGRPVFEREESSSARETVAQAGALSSGAPRADGLSGGARAQARAGPWGGGGELRAVSVTVQAHGAVLESGWGQSTIVSGHLRVQRALASALPLHPPPSVQKLKCAPSWRRREVRIEIGSRPLHSDVPARRA